MITRNILSYVVLEPTAEDLCVHMYVIVPDCPKSGSHSKSRSKSVNYVKFRVDGLYFVLFPVNGDSRTCGDRDELTETMPGKREILGKRLMRIYAAL